MSELYYTAVIKDGKVFVDADGFVYAEHFEDAAERDKRARQFGTTCHAGPEFMLYQGTEPAESWIARQGFRVYDPDGNETPDAYHKAIDAHAAKAGEKTVSKLSAPEVDDSGEKRPLPAWALAQSEVDAARQAVRDAEASVAALQNRADVLKAEATDTQGDSMTPDVKAALRRKAADVQTEADQASARLYHAQNDLSAKMAKLTELKPKEGKKNA